MGHGRRIGRSRRRHSTACRCQRTELIDMSEVQLGAGASRCAWCTALDRVNAPKNCNLHHISASLSVVSRVGCLVCLALACVSTSSMS